MAVQTRADEVPESPHDPDETLVPETPDGYREPTEFHYPMAILFVGATVLLAIAYVGFSSLLLFFQGDAVFDAVSTVTPIDGGEVITVDMGLVFGIFIAAILVTVVIHELIHGAVFRYYGYDVSYGAAPHMGAFYAAAFHQFVPREQIPWVAVAPLVAITLVGVPLLAAPAPLFALWVFFVLVTNASGAIGDLYIIYRTWRMPEGTLLYDSDIRHSYLFYPEEPA